MAGLTGKVALIGGGARGSILAGRTRNHRNPRI